MVKLNFKNQKGKLKVLVKLLGGKWEKAKRCFFPSFPLATKFGTFHWAPSLEHSIGHQAWNILLATKLGTFY
jgi:hypothetical protein